MSNIRRNCIFEKVVEYDIDYNQINLGVYLLFGYTLALSLDYYYGGYDFLFSVTIINIIIGLVFLLINRRVYFRRRYRV
jgi:hypothetical protein